MRRSARTRFRDLARHPVLDRQHGGRSSSGARATADAGRLALAGAGRADFKPRYFGDLRRATPPITRDGLGLADRPVHRRWLKVHPDDRTARELPRRVRADRREAGIGSISEIFDAEPPFTPRGCIAQAWSVAEVLRCLVKTAP
jgi:hypothetical protein